MELHIRTGHQTTNTLEEPRGNKSDVAKAFAANQNQFIYLLFQFEIK